MQRIVTLMATGTAILSVLGVFVGLIGCATSSGSLPTPEQLKARGMVAGEADIAALRRGRALAVTECVSCHRFYWPHEYTPGQWPAIAEKMGGRASLSKSQIEDLELYLVAASRDL